MNIFDRLVMKMSRIPNICRLRYYRHFIKGEGYKLADEVVMYYPSNISIGEGTYINGGHIIASENGKIVIGKNCLISYNVHIRCNTHCYKEKGRLISDQGHMEKDITIGDDVWIGFGAQLMPGVCLGEGCVIGAGAIVTKSTEPYGVYVGIPAKLIKYRE